MNSVFIVFYSILFGFSTILHSGWGHFDRLVLKFSTDASDENIGKKTKQEIFDIRAATITILIIN